MEEQPLPEDIERELEMVSTAESNAPPQMLAEMIDWDSRRARHDREGLMTEGL